MLIALNQTVANVPLHISLFTTVEMLEAAWIQLTAEGIANCFRKVRFVGPVTIDKVVEWPRNPTQVELWQCIIDAQLARPDVAWNEFVGADDDTEIAEPCTDEAIVCEV